MKTFKACVHIVALVGFAVSQRPCSPTNAYPLIAPDEAHRVNGGPGPATISIRVVGPSKSPEVIGQIWNSGSGREAGLIHLSRRDGQLRAPLQKLGDLTCVGSEFCFSFEDFPLCVDYETDDFRLADGTTGNFVTGVYTLPDGQTGNFSLEPGWTYPDTVSAAASTADKSAVATTDGDVMTGSSVLPSKDPETGVPHATSMENKVSGYGHATINGGRSSRVQQATMQATTAASNFTFAGKPSYPGKNISSFTLAPGNSVSSLPISFAYVARSPCGMWSPRILAAGIAIMVGLGFFSLL